MKSFIAFLSIISVLVAQHPVPVPGTQLSDFNGQWYGVWTFNNQANTNVTNPINCVVANIETTSVGGTIVEVAYLDNGDILNSTSSFTIGSSPSIWNVQTQNGVMTYDVLAIDPVAQSWALLGFANIQSATILSKTPQISNLIITAQTALLIAEGYTVNSTNTLILPSTLCPQ